jgi:hypothetical protein
MSGLEGLSGNILLGQSITGFDLGRVKTEKLEARRE